MLVNARVEGEYGAVRELKALIDFNAPYCTMLFQDALDLGYPQAGNKHADQERLTPELVPRFTEMRGIERGILFKLHKLSVGSIEVTDVDTVVLELETPRFITFDLRLGRSFLKYCKLTVDVGKGYVTLV
jgi:hypothetical protein